MMPLYNVIIFSCATGAKVSDCLWFHGMPLELMPNSLAQEMQNIHRVCPILLYRAIIMPACLSHTIVTLLLYSAIVLSHVAIAWWCLQQIGSTFKRYSAFLLPNYFSHLCVHLLRCVNCQVWTQTENLAIFSLAHVTYRLSISCVSYVHVYFSSSQEAKTVERQWNVVLTNSYRCLSNQVNIVNIGPIYRSSNAQLRACHQE